MTVLVVTSVPAEAEAIGRAEASRIVVGGIGRTNAAAATTESILRDGPFDVVLCAGIAGALPTETPPALGEVVVASRCVYAEEGLLTPEGFSDMRSLGFALGDFDGNAVPVDEAGLAILRERFRVGPIATVATCSGTEAAAAEVARRTGAVAEAMEGAAVVHAARRLGVAGLELRVISNTTGRRSDQVWDVRGALAALGPAVRSAVAALATRR